VLTVYPYSQNIPPLASKTSVRSSNPLGRDPDIYELEYDRLVAYRCRFDVHRHVEAFVEYPRCTHSGE